MIEFQPLDNVAATPGLVLRVGETDSRYLRLTHVFDEYVYAMWVSEPENVRYARRPSRFTLRELEKLSSTASSKWGRLALPSALVVSPPAESERGRDLDSAWRLIQPLIRSFEVESNLARSRFSYLIRERADAMQAKYLTLLRMVIRYYYFGGTRLSLLSLPPGVKPEEGYASVATEQPGELRLPKRRGRQAILARKLGRNDFVTSEDDIADMVECLKSRLRRGPTFLTLAHEDYLATKFKRRHPKIYAEYTEGKILVPVTARQYSYYINRHAVLNDELVRNLRTQDRKQGYLGSVRANGPGEVYEIDATGGRLYLVSNDDPPVHAGKPTIYLIIDRWSRFVVSIYLSLRSPSYEEVRHALLIAFTSREQRFKALGVDIDDERWPVGRMPAVLCPDRGSDFMSNSMEQAVVQNLRIELTPLPPLCPDGKAIVERFIREIKRRMAASGMKGTYADRPLDPISKRAARKAEDAAVHSLADAYRKLIEIIDDHNNRPHTTLKRMRVLSQNGVAPTPKSAYLWGLKNITGLRMAPLTDKDYQRLLLSSDTASISNGILRYKQRAYQPDNEAAFDIAAKSTSRSKSIDIRLDKTYPHEIFVVNSRREWASFQITPGAANELSGMSLDEEEAMSPQRSMIWAQSEHKSQVERVTKKGAKTKRSPKQSGTAIKVSKQQQIQARQEETADMKRKLVGDIRSPETNTDDTSETSDWAQIEEQERLNNLKLIRQHRSKK